MVKVGLWVRLDAKPGKEAEVEAFLNSGQAIVEAEPATVAWFAIRLDKSTFGIFDVFPDEGGRDAHLSGKVAEALLGSVGTLIDEPTIERIDVIAAKLST